MIDVSKSAIIAIKKQLDKRNTPDSLIRFGIRGGGCTGYSYVFEFHDKEPLKSDHIFEFDGIKIIVDPKSIHYLSGTKIEFETGIRGHGFKFNNPNISSLCGCGESINF